MSDTNTQGEAMDLTKIEKPFGLLDKETQEAIRSLPRKSIQRYSSGGGWLVPTNGSFFWRHCVYRQKPEELTMDVYPWDALRGDIMWCARDSNGTAYGYLTKPSVCNIYHTFDCDSEGEYHQLGGFKDYTPGTVNWKDSLQKRPSEGKQ